MHTWPNIQLENIANETIAIQERLADKEQELAERKDQLEEWEEQDEWKEQIEWQEQVFGKHTQYTTADQCNRTRIEISSSSHLSWFELLDLRRQWFDR